MKVTVNKKKGELQLEGSLITFTRTEADEGDSHGVSGSGADSTGEEAVRFVAGDITQLLRSKKNEKSAKIVVNDTTNYIVDFESLASREQFISQVVQAQGGKEEDPTRDWVTATVLRPAVDLGMVTEKELQAALDEECQRGVVQSIGALESLIHPDTLQLRPITDQIENDILREIPVLAVIFGRHVVSEETRRSFWEAVVRKYFCFARTFLEAEVQQVESTGVLDSAARAAPPNINGLASINAASTTALTGASSVLPAAVEEVNAEENDGVEARMLAEAEHAGETYLAAQDRLFYAKTPFVEPQQVLPSEINHNVEELFSSGLASMSARSSPREVDPPFTGYQVRSNPPAGADDKAALELLLHFWRGSVAERATTLRNYDNKQKEKKGNRKCSAVTAECLKRVRSVVEEMEHTN